MFLFWNFTLKHTLFSNHTQVSSVLDKKAVMVQEQTSKQFEINRNFALVFNVAKNNCPHHKCFCRIAN